MPGNNERTRAQFDDAVNMTAVELRRWLDTDESKSVGQQPFAGGESTGHSSGPNHRTAREKTNELTDDDYAHVRKVVGYAHRRLKQRRAGDIDHSRWRYSLMNWGTIRRKVADS